MEHINEIENKEKQSKKNVLISIAFIIAIFIFCFLLIIAIIVLLKNIEEIKTDPILYGMEKNGYDMCGCSGEGIPGYVYTIGDYNKLNGLVIDGTG